MGRWAKSHDQRKGQWLINKIREGIDYSKLDLKNPDIEKRIIELRLWNMTNEEFDRFMGDYFN